MRDIPDSLKAIKGRQAQKAPWIWLFELRYNSTSGQPLDLYLTDNTSPVTFASKTYQPYPIQFETIESNTSGDMLSASLTVKNIAREAGAIVEHYDGLRDERVIIIGVNLDDLGNPLSRRRDVFEIESATVTDQAVLFQLSGAPLSVESFPREHYMRDRCRWQFGSEQCGWGYAAGIPGIVPPTGVGLSYSCDKTLDGVNGCRVHGELYSNVGHTPLHPKRFGGFPLLPRRA